MRFNSQNKQKANYDISTKEGQADLTARILLKETVTELKNEMKALKEAKYKKLFADEEDKKKAKINNVERTFVTKENVAPYIEMLKNWIATSQSGNEKNYREAARRILECLFLEKKHLSLDGLGLETLPDFVRVESSLSGAEEFAQEGKKKAIEVIFPPISSLSLRGNKLSSLPEALDYLDLTVLNVASNKLDSVEILLGGLSYIHVGDNNLSQEYISRLQEFGMSGQIAVATQVVPPQKRVTANKTSNKMLIGGMTVARRVAAKDETLSLEERLDLLEKRLDRWLESEEISDAEYLQRVVAKRGIMKNFREQKATLDLSGLKLTEFPEILVFLGHVKKLDLSYNQFTNLPERDLDELHSIEVVDIVGNDPLRLSEAWVGQINGNDSKMTSEISDIASQLIKDSAIADGGIQLMDESLRRIEEISGDVLSATRSAKELDRKMQQDPETPAAKSQFWQRKVNPVTDNNSEMGAAR